VLARSEASGRESNWLALLLVLARLARRSLPELRFSSSVCVLCACLIDVGRELVPRGVEEAAISAPWSDMLCRTLASVSASSCRILARSLLAFHPSTWSVVIGMGLLPCDNGEIRASCVVAVTEEPGACTLGLE
jgi:hypothetical protein